MNRSSAKREILIDVGGGAGRSLMKREKSTEPRTDPCKRPRRTRKVQNFFEKLRKRVCHKGKIESSEQSKEGDQPK